MAQLVEEAVEQVAVEEVAMVEGVLPVEEAVEEAEMVEAVGVEGSPTA